MSKFFNDQSQFGRSRNARRRRNRNNDVNNYRAVTSNNLTASLPQSMRVELPWTDINLVKSGGSTFLKWRYRMNSVFDPDPILGGRSAYNFAQWAALYRRYRVIQFVVECVVTNNEAFPVIVNAAPSDADIDPVLISTSTCLSVGELPHAIKPQMLSNVGGLDRCTFRSVVNLPTYVGNKGMYMDDVTFAALVNANPGNLLYYNITVVSGSGANLTTGVTQHTKCYFRTLFTDINYDVSHVFVQNAVTPLTHSSDPDITGDWVDTLDTKRLDKIKS